MNYNANNAGRPGPGRKVKRVSDVNAMGAPAPMATPYMDPFAAQASYPGAAPQGTPSYPSQDYASFNAAPQAPQTHHQTGYTDFNTMPSQPAQQHQQPQVPFNPMAAAAAASGFGVFQQPMVQNMAMQYGQQLADQGKQMVESHFEKYIPVTRLKYYFAVDNKYVINKMRLLLFPFTHSNWSLRYDQDNPVQPRYDLNAPDLYIPTMAYITYVVLAGFVLGLQQKFSPEVLGAMASFALAVVIMELVVYSLALYITNIPTTLKTLDLLAYAGYKFTAIVSCILVGIVFNGFGYWITLAYTNATLAFFMTRTLYNKLKSTGSQADVQQPPISYDAYGVPIQQSTHHDYNSARKRKLYFTGLMVSAQIIITWALSRNLIAPTGVPLASAL